MVHTLIRAVAVGVGIQLGRQLVGSRSRRYPPTGWYSDPWREHTWRWWNGTWTGYTRD